MKIFFIGVWFRFVSRLPDQQFMEVPQQPYVDMASPTYPQVHLFLIIMASYVKLKQGEMKINTLYTE